MNLSTGLFNGYVGPKMHQRLQLLGDRIGRYGMPVAVLVVFGRHLERPFAHRIWSVELSGNC